MRFVETFVTTSMQSKEFQQTDRSSSAGEVVAEIDGEWIAATTCPLCEGLRPGSSPLSHVVGPVDGETVPMLPWTDHSTVLGVQRSSDVPGSPSRPKSGLPLASIGQFQAPNTWVPLAGTVAAAGKILSIFEVDISPIESTTVAR